MLFLHETHDVAGYHEDAFEHAFRDRWMPTLAEGDDARLLWYRNLAHGSTWSYRVVTVTAVRDGAACERLARRIQSGDLQDWMRELDTFRHDVHAKVLVPLPWSPMADLDLGVGARGWRRPRPGVYMEDTMWPYEDKFLDYIEASGSVYSKSLEHRDSGAPRFLEIEAGFQPAFGSHCAARSCSCSASSTPTGCRGCSRPTSRTRCARRAPGCTTRSRCATSGRASCCAPPDGRPLPELASKEVA